MIFYYKIEMNGISKFEQNVTTLVLQENWVGPEFPNS